MIDTAIMNISPIEPIFDRKKLLEMTASCIDDTYNRVSGDRFRVREGDKERIAYLKLLKEYTTPGKRQISTTLRADKRYIRNRE